MPVVSLVLVEGCLFLIALWLYLLASGTAAAVVGVLVIVAWVAMRIETRKDDQRLHQLGLKVRLRLRGDVYKRQIPNLATTMDAQAGKAGLREVESPSPDPGRQEGKKLQTARFQDDPGRRLRASRSRPGMPRSASECLGVPEACLLYTSRCV